MPGSSFSRISRPAHLRRRRWGSVFLLEEVRQPELVVNRHISARAEARWSDPIWGNGHFDAAMELLKKGELISARGPASLPDAVFPRIGHLRRGEARRRGGEPGPAPLEDPIAGKRDHKVKRGEALVTIASRNETTIDYIMRANGKTSEFHLPGRGPDGLSLNFRVEIDLKKSTVTVFDGDKFFKEYAIVDRNLPADLKAPVATTVSERVAWHQDQPVNFTHPAYMTSAKWIRTGKNRPVHPPGRSGAGRGRGVSSLRRHGRQSRPRGVVYDSPGRIKSRSCEVDRTRNALKCPP